MALEEVGWYALHQQLKILLENEDNMNDVAMQLARWAEAVAISEANRLIEALQGQSPKPASAVANSGLHSGDEWRVHFKLHSSHFDYFLWMLAVGTSGAVIAQLADEATAAVQAILESHEQP